MGGGGRVGRGGEGSDRSDARATILTRIAHLAVSSPPARNRPLWCVWCEGGGQERRAAGRHPALAVARAPRGGGSGRPPRLTVGGCASRGAMARARMVGYRRPRVAAAARHAPRRAPGRLPAAASPPCSRCVRHTAVGRGGGIAPAGGGSFRAAPRRRGDGIQRMYGQRARSNKRGRVYHAVTGGVQMLARTPGNANKQELLNRVQTVLRRGGGGGGQHTRQHTVRSRGHGRGRGPPRRRGRLGGSAGELPTSEREHGPGAPDGAATCAADPVRYAGLGCGRRRGGQRRGGSSAERWHGHGQSAWGWGVLVSRGAWKRGALWIVLVIGQRHAS